MWKHRPPSRFDFLDDVDTFAYFNYQYILYGMNFKTDISAKAGGFVLKDAADTTFARIVRFGEQATQELPSHRDLIEQVYANGFTDKPKGNFVAMPKRA